MATPEIPDPSDLLSVLEPDGRRVPKSIMDVLNQPSSMQVNFGISPEDYLGADLMIGHPLQSPFQGVPVAASASEYYEAITIHEFESGFFYDKADSGFYYSNNAAVPMPGIAPNNETGEPAQLTEVPTSTTNVNRPRTLAAGYDKHRGGGTLTVVFRDGTFYNYYEVDNRTWQNFKRARSKGRFIYTYLDQKPRGVADVAHLPSGARETLYRLSRTGQIMRGGLTGKQKAGSKRGSGKGQYRYRSGNLGGSTRNRGAKP